MHAKNNGRPLPALPSRAEVAARRQDDAPAKGLSAVLGAALGGVPGKAQLPPGKLAGAPQRPDKLDRAQKPMGGAKRTTSPRTGHR